MTDFEKEVISRLARLEIQSDAMRRDMDLMKSLRYWVAAAVIGATAMSSDGLEKIIKLVN